MRVSYLDFCFFCGCQVQAAALHLSSVAARWYLFLLRMPVAYCMYRPWSGAEAAFARQDALVVYEPSCLSRDWLTALVSLGSFC